MKQDFLFSEKSAIRELARQCIEASCGERPELAWLKQQYESMRGALSLSKAEMDSYLYQKMYGRLPDDLCEVLKIRYWRTGQHVPLNRRSCLLFGQALELSPAGQNYLLQAYLDKSIDVYEEVPSGADGDYWMRRDCLDALVDSYLERKNRAMQPGRRFSRENFRHLYYVDALRCIRQRSETLSIPDRHIRSVRYDAKLKNDFMLIGEISRKTMIRHLILLGLPDLTLDWLNLHSTAVRLPSSHCGTHSDRRGTPGSAADRSFETLQ